MNFPHFSLFGLSHRQQEEQIDNLKLIMVSEDRKDDAADNAEDLVLNRPGAVMTAIAKRGILWIKIMDNVCSWSQTVSST